MISPKDKAKEMVNNMKGAIIYHMTLKDAKRCALIAVSEILTQFGTRTTGQEFYTEYRAVEYYQQVKAEIEKL